MNRRAPRARRNGMNLNVSFGLHPLIAEIAGRM
jgi:hypothetical protein